jgi:hypothetical protein
VSVWWDRDDPANDQPPPYNNHRIDCSCDECRGEPPTPPSRWAELVAQAQAYLETVPASVKGEEPSCPICEDRGTIPYETHPYGHGFGVIVENVKCACQWGKP